LLKIYLSSIGDFWRKYNEKSFFIAILLITSLMADEKKWLSVGFLHNWYSSAGSEKEIGRRGRISDQQDGLRWPAQFKNQDSQVAKALWIGTTNYTDVAQYGGKKFKYKVVHVGPRVLNEESEFMPIEFKLIGNKKKPTVLVDGLAASSIRSQDIVDEINENQKSDRMLYNVVNTQIGITMTRKVYAFSQRDQSNYFIYEYVFRNTGNVDKDEEIEQSVALEGVYFSFQNRYAPTRDIGPYGKQCAPQSTAWGHSTMLDVRGEVPNSGDPFRAQFAWLGRHSQEAANLIGGPNKCSDGSLGAVHFMGTVVLHADTSPQNMDDDLNQPTTTYYIGSDESVTSNNSPFDSLKMKAEYAVMTRGDAPVRHADAVGDNYADRFGGTPGGYSHFKAFGPYNLNPGDSVRIVLAEAVAGLSRKKAYAIGATWLNGQSPYKLPDGTTTNEKDEYKKAWVYTGRDSLFQTFNRAITAFNNDFNIDLAPSPPDTFSVLSNDDHVSLSWAANAEKETNFGGYAIYRSEGRNDTIYQEIFNCGLNTNNPTVVSSYDDYDVEFGEEYFYYILTFSNLENNSGKKLYSSLFWSRTDRSAKITKNPTGLFTDTNQEIPKKLTLFQNYPNPFNPATKIRFYLDRTGNASVKIYDISGREVTTLKNEFLNTGFHVVEFDASNYASGIYIYEVTMGQQRLRKKMTLVK
jgi:Secretion system C-terminal sorting domain